MRRLSKKKKIAVLKRARKILSRPGAWTRGSWKSQKASKRDGYKGHAFCLLGGLIEAYEEETGVKYRENGLVLEQSGGGQLAEQLSISTLIRAKQGFPKGFSENDAALVFNYNDARRTTQAKVVALIDERIAQLEAE